MDPEIEFPKSVWYSLIANQTTCHKVPIKQFAQRFRIEKYMVKKVSWIVAIAAGIVVLAYPKLFPGGLPGAMTNSSAKPHASTNAPAQSKVDRSAKVLQVSVYTVEPIEFVETIAATGTVRADEGVELQAETSGKVVSINFQEGAPVKKGDLLVKLNDSDLRANLERYTYAKELAQVRFRRVEELMKQKVVSQDDYDTALNELRIQGSFIDLYKAQIEKTEIRAPFDGVVGLRFVSVGTYVGASTRIATLQRLDALKIDFSVPERYSGRVAVGGRVHFTVAGGIERFEGEIYAIDPRIDTETRTLLLRAVYPNSNGSVLPGAFTNVTVELETFPNAVLIPAEAVIPSIDKKVVYGMRDGLAQMLPVETGVRTSSHVHILSGLQPGDVVITSGLQQIRDGLPVQPLPAKKPPNASQDTAAQGASSKPARADKLADQRTTSLTAALAQPKYHAWQVTL